MSSGCLSLVAVLESNGASDVHGASTLKRGGPFDVVHVIDLRVCSAKHKHSAGAHGHSRRAFALHVQHLWNIHRRLHHSNNRAIFVDQIHTREGRNLSRVASGRAKSLPVDAKLTAEFCLATSQRNGAEDERRAERLDLVHGSQRYQRFTLVAKGVTEAKPSG